MRLKEMYFTMSDGVRLYTRIIIPGDSGKFPIVFMRTPYDHPSNGVPCDLSQYADNLFVKNGYALIWQHTRGTGDSEGFSRPYHERQDGLDSLDCIRKLPFYDGSIYVTGGSYLSTVHLCYLSTNPPDIKAAALSIQQDRMYYWRHHNGCCRNYCSLPWYLGLVKRQYPVQAAIEDALIRPYRDVSKRVVGEDIQDHVDMLLNDTYNDFWKNQENGEVAETLQIPVLFSDGWFDFYIDGMFAMWERLSSETREKSAFVVGPWGHATMVRGSEYPFPHGNPSKDYVVNFFNSVRDGTPYRDYALGRISFYSVAGDYWTTDAVPVEAEKRLYFGADRTLRKAPASRDELGYDYDPDRPLHYYRFDNIFRCPEPHSADGVLSFISEPAESDTEFFGRLRWHMKVKTNCDDTAFFMRVYFVEDGVSYNLTEGITSLSYLNPDYHAGEECLIDILTGPVGFTLKAGSRIRADISSHSDLYAPHANVRGHWALVEDVRVARNTVICDEEAYLALPCRR